MLNPHPNALLDGLFRSREMLRVFGDESRVQGMLDFEAALARAEALCGVIPQGAADAIGLCCRATMIDFEQLAAGARLSGNLAIPMVQQLTSRVLDAAPEAGGFVHWGATSQDVIDSGCVLQLREMFTELEAALERLCDLLATLCRDHRATPMAGRTWLQQAVPITFGWKVAGWLSALVRDRERFAESKPRVLTLQFGGAAGTLASMHGRGLDVAAALAEELGLTLADLPWHGARDRMSEVATLHGLLSGTLGKIARDLGLLMQTEVGEVAEATVPGRGGSSTMPHKRNPVGVAAALACTLRVPGLVGTMLSIMPQEHERGLGGWAAEWELLPEICVLTAGALDSLSEVFTGLQVFPAVMRRNLDATSGLLMAEAVSMELAKSVGRDTAHALLQTASRKAVKDGLSLRAVVELDADILRRLDHARLDRTFDPARYTGEADAMVTRVLARYEAQPGLHRRGAD